jgi:hypothetical protein
MKEAKTDTAGRFERQYEKGFVSPDLKVKTQNVRRMEARIPLDSAVKHCGLKDHYAG